MASQTVARWHVVPGLVQVFELGSDAILIYEQDLDNAMLEDNIGEGYYKFHYISLQSHRYHCGPGQVSAAKFQSKLATPSPPPRGTRKEELAPTLQFQVPQNVS